MPPPDDSTAVFELRDVAVQFGETWALRGFSLRIPAGEKIVLRGASGSGKSTILRLLLGFLCPDAGEVRFRGDPLTAEIAWSLRKEVAFVSQQTDPGTATVLEFLHTMGRFHESRNEEDARDAIRRVLPRLALTPGILSKSMTDLSGGERQRILLTSALLSDRPILLLDEPTSALDGELKEQVRHFVLEECRDRTVIAVAHDEVWFQAPNVRIIDLSSP